MDDLTERIDLEGLASWLDKQRWWKCRQLTLIGYLAAFCSMTSFTPQAWKIIKTRDTNSISAPMYAVTVVGFALWLAFGIMKSEWPIILTNGVCMVLSGFILMMTVLPRRQKDKVADALDPAADTHQPRA